MFRPEQFANYEVRLLQFGLRSMDDVQWIYPENFSTFSSDNAVSLLWIPFDSPSNYWWLLQKSLVPNHWVFFIFYGPFRTLTITRQCKICKHTKSGLRPTSLSLSLFFTLSNLEHDWVKPWSNLSAIKCAISWKQTIRVRTFFNSITSFSFVDHWQKYTLCWVANACLFRPSFEKKILHTVKY